MRTNKADGWKASLLTTLWDLPCSLLYYARFDSIRSSTGKKKKKKAINQLQPVYKNHPGLPLFAEGTGRGVAFVFFIWEKNTSVKWIGRAVEEEEEEEEKHSHRERDPIPFDMFTTK